MDFKRKVRKLKHLVIQSIYYQLLNASNIFMYNVWTYCKCDKFQGCRLKPRNRLENSDRSYCFICHVRVEYHADRIKNLKKIADIINFLKKPLIFSYAFILIHHVIIFRCTIIIFGCTITKQVG